MKAGLWEGDIQSSGSTIRSVRIRLRQRNELQMQYDISQGARLMEAGLFREGQGGAYAVWQRSEYSIRVRGTNFEKPAVAIDHVVPVPTFSCRPHMSLLNRK